MDKTVHRRILSINQKATTDLGMSIGQSLRGGELIELVSDLGGGKTTFVKGLALGIGYRGLVKSPSFSLSHEYSSPGLKLHHFDFYRLSKPGLMSLALDEVIGEQQAVVVIEWADPVASVLPPDRLTVILRTVEDNKRGITLSYPKSLGYLTANLGQKHVNS